MTPEVEPQLAALGAGLPTPELIIGRLLFALRRWTGNRESFDSLIRQERAAILALVESCDPESRARRVLIRRPPGLEDSSRYWSVYMTLDHLRIVHYEIARIIDALGLGRVPDGEASTAAVKPSPAVDASVVGAFATSCEALLASVARAGNMKTAMRFAHPWFGPLDAAGWHALVGGHLGIHRVQIERILEGLASGMRQGI